MIDTVCLDKSPCLFILFRKKRKAIFRPGLICRRFIRQAGVHHFGGNIFTDFPVNQTLSEMIDNPSTGLYDDRDYGKHQQIRMRLNE